MAALTAAPLVVERPALDWTVGPQIEAIHEEHAREAFTPVDGKPLAVWQSAAS